MSAQKKDPVPSSSGKTAGKIDPAVDPTALAVLTGQVRSLLAFHQEIGLTAYPAVPALRQFLKRVQRPPSVPAFGEHEREQGRGRQSPPQPAGSAHQQGQQGYQTKKTAPSRRPPAQRRNVATATIDATKPAAEDVRQQLKVLNQEITRCRCCTRESEANVILGQGSPTPHLLVAGDCFIGAASEQGQIWGTEEDAMLWRMMQAIGLDQNSVYVTNVIKCPHSGPVQPGSLTEKSCFTHLEKEIQIIQPSFICAMGDTATRALLKTKAPLVRLRGRFHSYRSPQGDTVQVMPTFHPRLLLQYPEMKQATWKDLQAVQRMLQVSSPER
ncbi:MAG: uracil-DNA glycosylase [Candidatus Electrothrix sp. Rat3]|nr:uracil-DNA glycosylase [Candidatus Electrothrix rattekaaiensis]